MDRLFQTLSLLLGFFGKLLVVPDTFQLLGIPHLVPIPFQRSFYILAGQYFYYQHIFFLLLTIIRYCHFEGYGGPLAYTTLDFRPVGPLKRYYWFKQKITKKWPLANWK